MCPSSGNFDIFNSLPTMATKQQTDVLSRFGANVRRERWRSGLTQEALAEQVEVHPRMIQKIEAGKSNLLVTTLVRLQAALGCPWDLLFSELGAPESVGAWLARMKSEHGSEWERHMRATMLAWALMREKTTKSAAKKKLPK